MIGVIIKLWRVSRHFPLDKVPKFRYNYMRGDAMTKLRVWWIPQVPMSPFYTEVVSVEEGVKIMNVLADYDEFQFQNKVKPDYSNVGGLERYVEEEGEWEDWYDEETGYDDPEEYLRERDNNGQT